MSELAFCKSFLAALDSRPQKLSSDHIADARQYPSGAVFVLPRLPASHPQRPNSTSASTASSSAHPTITLKPLKPTTPTLPLPSLDPAKTSVYDLKTHYASSTSIPASKIKILYKKKPVADSKTVAEVIGGDAGAEVEFGVMVIGGAVAGGTPAASPPAAAPSEAEKGLSGGGQGTVPAAQGPSGKEVVNEAFWDDLRGFVIQRIRDEKDGDEMVGVFRSAWEKGR